MARNINVEVVFASAASQELVSVSLHAGATVADAITLSAIAKKFPAEDLDAMRTGIWGRTVDRSASVRHGDRVEIYRPLLRDPRDARRELAQSGLTMREAADD
ncbi:MAG: RnfH family protein [Gammaproteobacteria bacterium]|nr:RnfH family protein [Gammaproteobacteria bacterium]MDH3752089.1 RnfH family protein [Gammaproteobacteria bacterium]MDH3805086.1 RnfH family protein [Gammaproteobacteria bacterium]